MARTVEVIKAKMIADVQSNSVLGSLLTSPSLTAIYNLWCYIMASAVNLFEQVQDLYISDAEVIALKTPPETPLWIQNQVFNFQYDSSGDPLTNVVVISPAPEFAVGYATKNSAFNIVTLCSVATASNNQINIKVAQGDSVSGYSAISGTALTQLDGFLTEILGAGSNHNLISQDADYLGIHGDVYYQNGYSGVIQANVLAAIKAYVDRVSISNTAGSQPVNYTGVIKVSELIVAIKGAEGVIDFNPSKITARAYSTPYASSQIVYDLAAGINNRSYSTQAGYIVEETGANDWASTLTFSAQV